MVAHTDVPQVLVVLHQVPVVLLGTSRTHEPSKVPKVLVLLVVPEVLLQVLALVEEEGGH